MINLAEIKEYLDKYHKFRIVFTGDSITSAEWVHPNWREIIEYVLKDAMVPVMRDWKQASWEIRGINCGYDGSTTADIFDKSDEILSYQPDLIIAITGGNDVWQKVPHLKTKANVEKILEKFSQSTFYTVWCTSTPAANEVTKNTQYIPYSEATMAAKHAENVQMLNMFEIYKKFDLRKFFTFKSEENPEEGLKKGDIDFWHPNQLGNAYIAKVILKEVFGVDFDPEKYIADTMAGEKFPGY